MERRTSSAVVALWSATVLLGCSNADELSSEADQHEEDDWMGCPAAIPRFEPGLHAAGDHFEVKVLSAAPTQPARYSNTWTVELEQPGGSPAIDAHITRSQTFMPVHGHDGRVVPEVTALENPGQYQVDRITFTMRGPWEVRFWLAGTDVDEDYVVLRVCVEK